MKDLHEFITEKALTGLCCSQIVLAVGMEYCGLDNPELVKAARGLCGGVHGGFTCGTLTGAACLISLICEPPESVSLIRNLTEWFTQRFASDSCASILTADPSLAEEHCLPLVAETLEKTLEILDECGRR
ncbi:MAG: C_GCAxxG_C_C family protein [Spirochaetales bacterium]|nr:C_GCAxxG_C_C family protein [Spirochaetales bacterium]